MVPSLKSALKFCLIQLPSYSLRLLFVFLCGCGYHGSKETLLTHLPPIYVPYFSGDQDGRITEAILGELSTRTHSITSEEKSRWILRGSIMSDHTEHVGYQYDRRPISGDLVSRLVPNEGRRTIQVHLSIYDSISNTCLLGPFNVTATSDYDFVDSDSLDDTAFLKPSGELESSLFFSLGQLDSAQGAHKSVKKPLSEQLAKKVVDGLAVQLIRYEWDKGNALHKK